MNPLTMRRSLPLAVLTLVAAMLLPGRAMAQQRTETVVPVGATVGMGPNGATLRCRDGFFPAPGAADSACQARGGVAARYPIRRTPTRAADAEAALRAAPTAPRPAAMAPQADTTRPPGFEPIAVRRARRDSLNRASSTRPAGATLLCNNGTWILRDTVQARCASHGGVRAVLTP